MNVYQLKNKFKIDYHAIKAPKPEYLFIKRTTFKSFYSQNLNPDLENPSYLGYLNYYFFIRLAIFDICYLTLTNIPRLQILTLLVIEGCFLGVVVTGWIVFKGFESKWIYYRFLL